jgi:DNA invertase Pin-like site-specific DNA recombinase
MNCFDLGGHFVSPKRCLEIWQGYFFTIPVFAAFEHDILRERVRAGLAHARQNGKQLGRPMTAGLQAAEIRKLHRVGVAKAEIARQLQVGRTSVRRILAAKR